MKNSLVFAQRNLKEMSRDVLSWIFCLGLPLLLLLVCRFVFSALPQTPSNFALQNFGGGILVFSYSFLSLFCGATVAKDRAGSLLKRLYLSPATAKDFISGYLLCALPIAAGQAVCVFLACVVLGMPFDFDLLAAAALSLPVAVFYVFSGVVLGCVVSDKAVAGVASLLVNVAALLSGMWFDLSLLGSGFDGVMHFLPFANAYDVVRYACAGQWANVWLPFAVCAVYAAGMGVVAVVLFAKKSKK